MWISRRELKRLLRAETQLHEERSSHDRMIVALIDRILTAAGRYGLAPDEKGQTKTISLPPPPAPLINNYLDEATLASFMEDAAAEGKSPQEAIALFKRYKSGASLPYETDNLIEH